MLPIENGEEVVDAGAPASQAVDALQLKGERREHRHERHQIEVLLERRIALDDRDQPALESDAVREDERPHRQKRVADDVERDEQPVVASYHRVPRRGSQGVVDDRAHRWTWRSRENRSA